MIAIEYLQGIRAFVTTIHTGSFTNAAKEMKLSRSAVGKAVAKLEDRLGAQLLIRTTRKMVATEAGEIFYARCVSAMTELDIAQFELQQHKGDISGTVRIEVPVEFGRLFIMPALYRLQRIHPGLLFQVGFSNDIRDLVEGGVDLTIRFGTIPDSLNLVARRVVTQQHVVCASPEYLKTRGIPEHPDDLSSHNVILEYSDKFWQFYNQNGELYTPFVHQGLVIQHIGALMDASIGGRGIVRLPRWLAADALARGTLVELFEHICSPHTPAHLLWVKSSWRNAKINVVIEHLTDEFRFHPLLQPKKPCSDISQGD